MFNLKKESRFIKVSLVLILSLFFILGIYSVFRYGNWTLIGSIQNYNNDDVKYIRSASVLLSTGNFVYRDITTRTVFIMPGLPFVLAFFMKLFGFWGGITALRVFHVLLETLSLLLVFYIGRKVFNSKAAIVAVLLNALYIPDVWVANLILTEAIFKFLFLLLIYVCLYAVEEKKLGFYIAGGIIWGLSALFRPPIAAFPVVILILWIKNKYKFTEIVKYTVVVAAIFVLILSPWWIRNYRLFDKFIPFTAASGNPMLQGTYIEYGDDDSDKYVDRSAFKYTNNEIENNKIEVEYAKLRMKTLISREPVRYIYWYTVGKTIRNWKFPFYWVKQMLGVSFLSMYIYHLALLSLGILGMFFYFKKRERNSGFTLLMASVVYMNCIYLPYFCFARYVYPVIPLVIISASYALLEIIRHVKMKKDVKSGEHSGNSGEISFNG